MVLFIPGASVLNTSGWELRRPQLAAALCTTFFKIINQNALIYRGRVSHSIIHTNTTCSSRGIKEVHTLKNDGVVLLIQYQ